MQLSGSTVENQIKCTRLDIRNIQRSSLPKSELKPNKECSKTIMTIGKISLTYFEVKNYSKSTNMRYNIAINVYNGSTAQDITLVK